MEIYRSENKNAFISFITANSKLMGNRHRILSSLPIHTISEELLSKILKRNTISAEYQENIFQFVKQQKEIIENILTSNNIITDEIFEMPKSSFIKCPNSLSLADSFYEEEIKYTYNEYLEHLNLTKEYSENHNNYHLNMQVSSVFKNIQIAIHEGKIVMISKNTNPTIHFVIEHPKLRNAIENFIPPVVD